METLTMVTRPKRTGELALAAGYLTEPQLDDALVAQRTRHGYQPLGQILVEQRLLSRRTLDQLLDRNRKRARLGELLLKASTLSEQQLAHGLDVQRRRQARLGEVLVDLDFVAERAMREALAAQMNIPFVDLDRVVVSKEAARLINASYARRHLILPVSIDGQTLTVAMDDPTMRSSAEELARTAGVGVTVVVSCRDAMIRAFDRLYAPEAAQAVAQVETIDLITEEDPTDAPKNKYSLEHSQGQKATDLVRQIVRIALERGSSDIHLESLADAFRIRFRADGVLQDLSLGTLRDACNQNARQLISRIKILAKLDIGERRRPQDGSFRVRVERKGQQTSVDFRVSVVPGYYGENVVMRILDRSRAPQSVDRLGFSQEVTRQLHQLLRRPSGIFLVTGPTGSGKSTTLYASLMTIYRPQIRILTVEDPIEYVYEQFSQSEVNERVGNTFASYLRAFLRHDPEVIMVGEIRDQETAAMAFRAAQTGHLVISTMHTNSAIGAVSRLLDLDVDSNLIASALIGVLSQRLVREICPECKAPYTPSRELLAEFYDAPPQDGRWTRGQGCQTCNFSGYKGRMSVAELWTPSDEDVIQISKGVAFEEIRRSSLNSTISMAQDVSERLAAGRTTLDELARVLPYPCLAEFKRLHAAQATSDLYVTAKTA